MSEVNTNDPVMTGTEGEALTDNGHLDCQTTNTMWYE